MQPGRRRLAGAIALASDTPPVLRIAADGRSAGVTCALMLRIGDAGRSLIFLTSGAAPFTLAAGRTDAGDPFLSAGDLMDGQGRAPRGGPCRLILWAVLAGIAWRVWRRDVRVGPDPAA